MGSVPTLPQVSDIAPPQTQSATPVSGGALDGILASVAQMAQAPLPSPYAQGTTIAEPRVPTTPQYTPKNTNNQPLNNQATSLRQARTQNAFGALANMVGQAGQNIQNKKTIELKEDLKTVMQAKQNVANAQAVLQQDPNNKMAQSVLAANKQALDAILSDPKKQKKLAKALDISFTDPDKNKTPEVQAYKQAQQEVKQAGPFTSNNPAEHQVAQEAKNNELGDNMNKGVQAPPQQQAPQSATPYADKALAKDLPSMQPNPQYAVALQQQQAAQKALYTQVLPKVIEAQSRMQIQAVKDGNAAARLEYRVVTDAQKEQARIIGQLTLQDQKAKDALILQSRKDAAAMGRVVTVVSAKLKIAEDKRLDPNTKSKLQTEALQKIDQSVTALTAQRASLTTQMSNAKNEDEKKVLKAALDLNSAALMGTNKYRLETSEKVYGRLAETRDGGSESGANSTGVQRSTTAVAGDGLSDEDSDDEDDNSDDF